MTIAKVRAVTLIAFCTPSLPLAAAGLPLIVYLPPYYASVLQMPIATVGAVFFSVRVVDVLFDMLLGPVIDRTRSRFGRYRPWLLVGAIVMAIGTYLLFFAKPGVTWLSAAIGLGVFYCGYSMAYLGHTALGSTLSDDYDERTRVFGAWQVANILGMILVLLLPVLTSKLVDTARPATGIHAMGWFVCVLLPITALIVCAVIREQPRPRRTALASHISMIQLLRGPYVARLLTADLLLCGAAGMTGALFQFWFAVARGFAADQISLLLLTYFVTGLLFAPLWTLIARRLGKHVSIALASIWVVVAQLSLIAFMPSGSIGSALAWMIFAGVPYAAAPYLLRAILADVCDAEELRTGQDRTGSLYAALTATQKIAFGLPVGILYPSLAAFGFDAAKGIGNTSEAILALNVIFAAGPATAAGVGAWLMWGWRLDADAHQTIKARLHASGLQKE